MTGAGRGIGRAIALDLARTGYPVALQSRTRAELEETKAVIEADGGRAIVVPGDVTDVAAAEALVAACEDELGAVQIAVPCAGQALSAPLSRTTPEQIRGLFEVNTMSAFHLVKAAASAMKASKTRGRIVVVASTAAVAGMAYTSAYSASKHAVLGLVRSAALELARAGITVNAVCPGWVKTDMFEHTLANIAEKTGGTVADAQKTIEARIPIGSTLSVDEVAAMVRYVVSDEAARLTGQALVLDGGESIA